MKLPQGRLRRRRVVTDLATPLSRALEDELTGYARLKSQDALLLDSEGVGIVTFDCGVPVLAYHTGTDCGGTDALADIAVAGPYRVELYDLDHEALAKVHDTSELAVEPGMPAEQLAGDGELAQRTRDRAPEDRVDQGTEQDAVEAFLEDENRIADIQEAARQEAEERASEWGFDV
jgi:hypothetical protein